MDQEEFKKYCFSLLGKESEYDSELSTYTRRMLLIENYERESLNKLSQIGSTNFEEFSMISDVILAEWEYKNRYINDDPL